MPGIEEYLFRVKFQNCGLAERFARQQGASPLKQFDIKPFKGMILRKQFWLFHSN